MKCENHSEREAIAVCVNCQKGLCEDCKIQVDGKNYCKECVDELGLKSDKEKSSFENFVSDFVLDIQDDVNNAKNKLDGFIKEKGVDEGFKKFINNMEERKNLITVKDPFEALMKTKKLLDDDIISEEEFQQIKDKQIENLNLTNFKSKDPYNDLRKVKELYDVGAINEDEFTFFKEKYLENI